MAVLASSHTTLHQRKCIQEILWNHVDSPTSPEAVIVSGWIKYLDADTLHLYDGSVYSLLTCQLPTRHNFDKTTSSSTPHLSTPSSTPHLSTPSSTPHLSTPSSTSHLSTPHLDMAVEVTGYCCYNNDGNNYLKVKSWKPAIASSLNLLPCIDSNFIQKSTETNFTAQLRLRHHIIQEGVTFLMAQNFISVYPKSSELYLEGMSINRVTINTNRESSRFGGEIQLLNLYQLESMALTLGKIFSLEMTPELQSYDKMPSTFPSLLSSSLLTTPKPSLPSPPEEQMLNLEIAFVKLGDLQTLMIKLFQSIIANVLQEGTIELCVLSQNQEQLIDKLEHLQTQSPLILTYKQAVRKCRDLQIDTGPPPCKPMLMQMALSATPIYVEGTQSYPTFLSTLCTHLNCPIIITNMPHTIKACYLEDNLDRATVASLDLYLPGIGIVASGGLREVNPQLLAFKLYAREMEGKAYRSLRGSGNAPHGGFSFNLDRLLQWISSSTAKETNS